MSKQEILQLDNEIAQLETEYLIARDSVLLTMWNLGGAYARKRKSLGFLSWDGWLIKRSLSYVEAERCLSIYLNFPDLPTKPITKCAVDRFLNAPATVQEKVKELHDSGVKVTEQLVKQVERQELPKQERLIAEHSGALKRFNSTIQKVSDCVEIINPDEPLSREVKAQWMEQLNALTTVVINTMNILKGMK